MKNCIILALIVISSSIFAAEYLTRMQKLLATKNQLARGVELVQREYDHALNTENFDQELLKQIKQSLFTAMDKLNVINKKIIDEHAKIKEVLRTKSPNKSKK